MDFLKSDPSIFLAQASETAVFWTSLGFRYYKTHLFILELIGAFFSLVFLGVIIYIIIKINLFRDIFTGLAETYTLSSVDKRRVLRAWLNVEKRARSRNEADIKLSVIEADKILDELLKVSGFRGEVMADRLGQVSSAQISNIDDIWRAHKLRNRLVHEPDFEIYNNQALELLNIYRVAFEEFGLLQKK